MIRKKSGFTLIELLIAISILSSLLFLGTYSYQMLAGRWENELKQFDLEKQTSKNINLLYDLLKGVQPFIVMEENNTHTKPAFFYIGHEKSLLSLSRAGVFSKDFPEIFRLTARKKENELYDLIYQSVSTQQVLLLTTTQTIEFTHEIILLSDLDNLSFEYLGWDGYLEYAESTNTLQPPTWRNKFSGIDNQLLPLKMKVIVTKSNKTLDFIVPFDRRTLRYLSSYIDF